MKSGLSILDIILGFGFLIVFTLQYFLGDSSSYYVPLIFFFLIFIMMGIFEFRGYKIVYVLSAVLLIVMWIVSFIKPISPDVNETFYYVEIGLITLAISMLFVDSLKRLRKKKKALEPYDKALELFPEFSVHWTNKGSDLLELSRYLNALNVLIRL